MDRRQHHLARGEDPRSEEEPAGPDLEELLALTAHELHEPLLDVTQFGGLLRERAGASLDAESLAHLARIEEAAGHMRATLSRVIAFARVPRGLPFVTIDLHEVVRGA